MVGLGVLWALALRILSCPGFWFDVLDFWFGWVGLLVLFGLGFGVLWVFAGLICLAGVCLGFWWWLSFGTWCLVVI